MKKVLLSSFLVLSSLVLFGQKKSITQPLIIKGQLTNYPEKKLVILFKDIFQADLTDTINVDKDGRFYLKTYKIKNPQRVNVGYNKTSIPDIAVAPGYSLTITADCKDRRSTINSVNIQGRGALANQYSIILNSALYDEKNIHDWDELNAQDLLNFVNKDSKLRDSVTRLVFDKTSVKDKYFHFFGKMARLDNMFYDTYYLIEHTIINILLKKYNYEKSVAFVKSNIDNQMLNNIGKAECMTARNYKMVLTSYLSYLTNRDYLRDSTLRNRKYYPLEKAAKLYSGTAKQYILYNLITSSREVPSIAYASSFNDLSNRVKQLTPYITMLSNQQKKAVKVMLSEKDAELTRTAAGSVAPAFTLKSDVGATYDLADFKGKAVFIDLWASWCVPCRAETPYLKTLYNKYKNDTRIAFISVGVWDDMNKWEKALQEDKPDWLQLFDKDNLVVNAYGTHGIPKFILIDKQGNIALLDTPMPSDGRKLEDVLLNEMEK